jgi:hypothetical protein
MEGIMIKTLVNALRIFVCAVFTMQLMGCGTLMYPERRGQRGGSIDAGVAVLDGIGLLFGIIPGVIAFAVDFSNGTIYLPERTKMGFLDLKNIREVKFDSKHTSLASIERIIKDETGCEVKFSQDNIKLSKLKSLNEMMVQFAQAGPVVNNDRIALLQKGDLNEYIR